MKKVIMVTTMVGAFAALSACGQFDDLRPPDHNAAHVLANTQGTIDTVLVSEAGQEFPARIYFNTAGRRTAERLAEMATVLVESPEVAVDSVREGSSSPDPETRVHQDGWAYIRLGEAADGTQPAGWHAPFEAIGMADDRTVDAAPLGLPNLDGDHGAQVGAKYDEPFSYSTTGTASSDWIGCNKGAEGEQNTALWPAGGGAGDLFLEEDSAGNDVSDDFFMGFGQYSYVDIFYGVAENHDYRLHADARSGTITAIGGLDCY